MAECVQGAKRLAQRISTELSVPHISMGSSPKTLQEEFEQYSQGQL